MSSEVVIAVEHLSKCYQIYEKPRDRLLQMFFRGHRKFYREFWALRNVSFEVREGETVGIIGRNGSGKSTLLQMICGTLNPTGGAIRTEGRIAALLELGSGFNPEFTGRENVYMNASILGLTHEEIDARFNDIADFADIGEFIEQPIKMYSSGMVVRLAFAVQSQVNPDILIVDEALSVGDAKFQAKCFDRLHQLKRQGTSILLVTHSGEQIVTHCNRAILLNNGAMVEQGEPKRMVNLYLDMLFGREKKEVPAESESPAPAEPDESAALDYPLDNAHDVFATRPGYNPHEYRWGDGAAAILDYYLEADGVAYPASVSTGQAITLAVAVKFLDDLVRPILGLTIKNKEGVTIYGVNSETLSLDEFKAYGQSGTVVHAVARLTCRLAHGDYFISLGIATRSGEEVVPHDRRYDAIHLVVMPEHAFFGLCDLGVKLNAYQYTL